MPEVVANANLTRARNARNDEFYTQYFDIEREINAYLDYNPHVFKDKTILLPCDDPEWSNFTKFFAQNFDRFKLKKLISTSYAHESKIYKVDYEPSLFETQAPQFDKDKTKIKGKIFTLCRDKSQNKKIDIHDLKWSYLEDDGDFKSKEVTKLRDEADMIITNPPFSLFREFLAWIVEAKKDFLIIGNMNAITYKEVFPLIKENKMWLGNGFKAGNAYFSSPITNDYADGVFNPDTGLVKFRNVIWLTNLEHGKRHQPLALMSMEDNIRFNKKLKGQEYQKYDNYNAIEVSFTNAIPNDYDGVMGVPISFLDKFNPEQFEIIGMAEDNGKGFSGGIWDGKNPHCVINGKNKFKRIFIKHKNPQK